MGALHTAVTSGKATYAGISNYPPSATREAARILADLGTPLLIHQPSYSMLNRHVERVGDGEQETLLDAVGDLGVGLIVFSPLAQGMLTDRYLGGQVPPGSRMTHGRWLGAEQITPAYLATARALDQIASVRGQSLAQLALAWVLRDQRVTSALVGASSVAQLEANVAALAAGPLTDDELAAIEAPLTEGGLT
jgi:L-glyceraldehyde 3-phosphate reductase